LIHLHRRADTGQEFDLCCKAAVAVAKKSKTGAAGESAGGETEPGNNAHPVNFAFASSEKHENKGERTGKRECRVQAPTNSRGIAEKHVGKPDRNRRGADVHEKAERKKIAGQGQVPPTITKKPFDLRDEQGDKQVGDEERGGVARSTRGRLLKKSEQGQQNENRARINDLPLEMVPVRLMEAHARGRVSCELV
jgi:hypothetical protein